MGRIEVNGDIVKNSDGDLILRVDEYPEEYSQASNIDWSYDLGPILPQNDVLANAVRWYSDRQKNGIEVNDNGDQISLVIPLPVEMVVYKDDQSYVPTKVQSGIISKELPIDMVIYKDDRSYIPAEVQNVNIIKEMVKTAIINGCLPNPDTMKSDYQFFELGGGIGKLISGAVGGMIDKQGNVYAIIDVSAGLGIATPITATRGWGYLGNMSDKEKEDYAQALSGWSLGTTTGGGVQGNVSIGPSGVISAETSITPGIGKAIGGRNAWFLFNVNK